MCWIPVEPKMLEVEFFVLPLQKLKQIPPKKNRMYLCHHDLIRQLLLVGDSSLLN